MHDAGGRGPLYCWGGLASWGTYRQWVANGRLDERPLLRVQSGLVRNIEPPYRRGRGIEIRFGRFEVGLGLMNIRMRRTNDEDLGLARVLDAEDVVATPKQIGVWDGDPQSLGGKDQRAAHVDEEGSDTDRGSDDGCVVSDDGSGSR